MTNPKNWPNPERPGVVMWPHKDGRHLFALGGGYIVAFWRADKQWLVCDDDHDLGFCASDRVKDLNYIGPVLTPAQISELLAGERERCAKKAQEISDKYYAERESAYHQDDREYADERMSAAHECARAIRNLGAAP